MATTLRQAFCSFDTLLDEINDWCHVRSPKGFPPRPKNARDLMLIVAIHNLAAELDNDTARHEIQTLTFAQLHQAAIDAAVRWN